MPSARTRHPWCGGGEETNGQHAFHQLLHQGTRAFSADFIAIARAGHALDDHHDWLLANCLAQSKAMLEGRAADGPLAEHRSVPGGHPSTTILLDELSPRSLGALLAIYEHKVFCLGAIWQINAFDQWGVELGKELAGPIYDELASGEGRGAGHDASTAGLLTQLRRARLMANIYPVEGDIRDRSHIDSERYAEMYEQSIADPDSFWSERAREFVDWYSGWDRGLLPRLPERSG